MNSSHTYLITTVKSAFYKSPLQSATWAVKVLCEEYKIALIFAHKSSYSKEIILHLSIIDQKVPKSDSDFVFDVKNYLNNLQQNFSVNKYQIFP